MSKIKFLIFMILAAALVAPAPVAAYTPAPPLPGIEGPGGVPHYFGPFGNWAFSPLPKGPVAAITVVAGGSGYTAPVVTINDAYITPTILANVSAIVTGGVITGFTIVNGGADYVAPVVTITDSTGTGAIADAVIGAATLGGTLTGGMLKFVDKLPGLGPGAANALGQFIPVAVPGTAPTPTPASPASDYYEIALVE
ncbi:MAG: hypothetical protein MUP68_17310, partial [Deltaproteobacteria bacterium]|nr:hypothetical protein [Deltaproteobacteria bacterium]